MNRQFRQPLSMVCAVLVLVVAGLQLSACSESSTKAAGDPEPAKVEPIKGTSSNRVILSAKAAERLGIETAPIREKRVAGGGASGTKREVIPYSAVLYTRHGRTFTYTNPEPLAFVRQPISVDYIKGDQAVLSHGPPSGTAVVTVGAQELFGVEYEVEED